MMNENGGWLDLSNTNITSLPDNLTVGGSLDLRNTNIKDKTAERRKIKGFFEGKYKPNAWLYCDGMLIHVKRKKKIGNYTYYVGKIPSINVVFDGEHYAHCESLKQGILDLEFKKAKNRGAEQYNSLTLESVLTYDEAIIAYRIITGACQAGTQTS
jgi:methionine salvage enolase-phosphatase E1